MFRSRSLRLQENLEHIILQGRRNRLTRLECGGGEIVTSGIFTTREHPENQLHDASLRAQLLVCRPDQPGSGIGGENPCFFIPVDWERRNK